MKKNRGSVFCTIVLLLGFLLAGPAGLAALDALDNPWWTVDSGGGTSTGGSYLLSGTIGQPDVGTLSGGEYLLAGGFWSESVSKPLEPRLYLPLVNR